VKPGPTRGWSVVRKPQATGHGFVPGTLTWLHPRLVHVKEMRFAMIDHACAVRRVDDGAISADDIHHAPVFHRALFHLLRV
jgi:hypothetical protein